MKSVLPRLRAVVALSSIGLTTPMETVDGHPFHESRGEAELNLKTGHLEVSVSVEADGLAKALTSIDGRPVAWGDAELMKRIDAYLRARFSVQTPAGHARFALAGWVPDGQRVWLHFEIRDVHRLHDAVITNRLLMEVEPAQVNTLRLKAGSFQKTLIFDRSHRQHRLDTSASAT